MTIDNKKADHIALYERWAAMWNGNPDIANDIIGSNFVAHLSADATTTPEEICNGKCVRQWIHSIHARLGKITYQVEVGPLVDGDMVTAYWRVTGVLTAPGGGTSRVTKVGIDILRIEDGRFVEYWTLNNNGKTN